jgi:hypothetical protein
MNVPSFVREFRQLLLIEQNAIVKYQHQVLLQLLYGTVARKAFFFNGPKVHRFIDHTFVGVRNVRILFYHRFFKQFLFVEDSLGV